MELRKAVPYINLVDQPWWKKIVEYIINIFTNTHPISGYVMGKNEADQHKEQIRQYLLQKPTEEMFVRPEEPKAKDYLRKNKKYGPVDIVLKTAQNKWQNWQPVFVNYKCERINFSWAVIIEQYPTINNYVAEYSALSIELPITELHWNPEHLKVRELFYPDIEKL
jgi:hypothetical protein